MINDIRSSFEILVTNIQSFLDWADSVDKNDKLLKEFDHKLRDREKIINKKVDNLILREGKLKSDSLIVDEKINELEKTKVQAKTIDHKLAVLKREEEEIAKKHTKLDEREGKISTREKELETLKDTEKELDHRETLLKKEMLMDKIRQEKMDKREKDLDKERDRLQKVALQLNAV